MRQSALIVLVLMTGGFLYVWMYHPNAVNSMTQTVRKADVAGEAARLAKAKEDRWQAVYRPHSKCGRERTELERLECSNDRDNQRAHFETQWRNAAAKGLKP